MGRSVAASNASHEDNRYSVPLYGFRPIVRDISLAYVRSHAEGIYALRDKLLARHRPPLYLPFQFKQDRSQLSFMSNYFAKLPHQLVTMLFGETTEAGVARLAVPELAVPELAKSALPDVLRSAYLAPFKPKADTKYATDLVGGTVERERRHETLVNDCAAWLTKLGYLVQRNAAVDLAISTPSVVIFEAKVFKGSWADVIRQAVGPALRVSFLQSRGSDRSAHLPGRYRAPEARGLAIWSAIEGSARCGVPTQASKLPP